MNNLVVCYVSSEDSMAVQAITAEQMREIEKLAGFQYGIQAKQMIENAGRSLARVCRLILGGKVFGRKIIVLAGSGKSAGSGLAGARNLHDWGADVHVVIAVHEDALKKSATNQLNIIRSMDIPVDDARKLNIAFLSKFDLIIDALLGYSSQGSPSAEFTSAISTVNKSKKLVVSVDVPAGLDATTGQVYDSCIKAAATLALAVPKTGLFKDTAAECVGDLWLADIGIPPETYAKAEIKIDNPFIEEDIMLIRRKGKAISISATASA